MFYVSSFPLNWDVHLVTTPYTDSQNHQQVNSTRSVAQMPKEEHRRHRFRPSP
ncbi:MAG: hypothetical protein ACI3Y0_06905 [Prevotella sp.]